MGFNLFFLNLKYGFITINIKKQKRESSSIETNVLT